MKVLWQQKTYELQGGDAWTEKRFEVLKEMNPKGKLCIVEVDGKREKYLVPIGEVDLKPEPVNY